MKPFVATIALIAAGWTVTHVSAVALAQPDLSAVALAEADARQVALSAPQAVADVDLGKLKGQPSALAWSPDAKELYLQTAERNRSGAVTSTKHYVASITSKSIKGVGDQPAWAAKYWSWKSGQTSPASPLFRIGVETRTETVTATAAVGNMAKGGGGGADGLAIPGTSAEEVGNITSQQQKVTIYALKVKGVTLGEWRNEAVVPGLNFGWAPAPHHLIAYTKRDGGPLVILDEQGRKQELAGPKEAVLPAWSDDGKKLAWLERKDRRTYDLTIADVMVP
jgi:hypothetical protein